MKKICVLVLSCLLIVGCATIGRDSVNYYEKDQIAEQLKGNESYVASGYVNMYSFGFIPIGKIKTVAAIQVEKDSGKIVRLVTVKKAGQTTDDAQMKTTLYGSGNFMLSDLTGGISALEIHRTNTWNEALAEVSRNAVRQ
jgi:hypothetical protein